ncbi:uncharacterized protein LOC108735988 [Agrilus planipennis]|uniref:Uncharacterized protein LOC108735988 n=1 Tax=Agrilus planipennis TaxID=224129 RepID=A0A7F5RKV9_AGRPL|nr:uncharacterized protein LOC108735988 [Agrilus planipennis]
MRVVSAILIVTINAVTILGAAYQTNDVSSNSIASLNNTKNDKCSQMYVCPPNFLRINQNCYYFSTEAVPWRTAFDDCIKLKGTLAMIRNINQDNNIKGLLKRVPLAKDERWIGGLYDWTKMNWKWGKNAKEIKYLGFDASVSQEKDQLQWKCITLDPILDYRWNARSCFENKHYICQTRIAKIPKSERKKFIKKFNANKNNKMNEVLAPNLTEDFPEELKTSRRYNSNLQDTAFARRNETVVDRRRGKKNGGKKKRKNKRNLRCPVYYNGTRYEMPVTKFGRKKRKNIKSIESNSASAENLKSVIYYEKLPNGQSEPRVLTEELFIS